MRRISRLAVFAAAILSANLAFAAKPAATVLRGSAPSWANAKNYAGTADPNGNVGFRVYLAWQNAPAAEALARAVTDPRGSQYGRYLTPQQFRQQFAPSQSDVVAVQSWLRNQGFSINYTPANNHYVVAEGTVAQAEAAFGTKMGVYNVKGQSVRSPVGDVTIPTSIANAVTGVLGLDESATFVRTNHIKDAPPSEGFRNAPPLSAYWAQYVSPYAYPNGFKDVKNPSTASWTVRGYTPAQIKSQIVPPGVYKRPQNPRQDPQGWYGEETLDIEAVHGMAPAAKIVYVAAPNNYQDLDAAMNHVVDQGLAQIVTNSYGFSTELLPPGYVKPFEDTLVQAAIQGIGVYFSSGDDGDETVNFGFATTDWPASSPWVTAVGGTSIAISSSGSRVFETGWGTSNYGCNSTTLACTRAGWLYGSGGGVSQIFAAPFYQSGLGYRGRAVPDVAALGDPQTGMIVGQTQTFPDGSYYDEYRIGGTSLASPIFAGLMALADQKSGRPHGFANPVFYSKPAAFFDVTSVKTAVARRNFVNSVDASDGTSDFLRTFDDYSGSPTQFTAPGWDNVTGLGTPNSSFLNLISP